ncbi:MAG: hypothetical protein IJ431_03280 [Alistipes sp.]|nr:hypothetical protein [Alistipes sp.]
MFVNLATNKISFDDPAKQALYDYVEESIRRGLPDETITSVYMSANEDYTQDDIAFLRFVLRYMDLIDGRTQEPIEKLADILSDINKRAQELIDNNKEDSPEYTYLRRKEEAVEDEYWRKITADEAAEKMRTYIEALCTNRNLSFANARTMKLLARTIYEQVVLRESHDKTSPRRVVLLEDVKSYNWQQSRRLGY